MNKKKLTIIIVALVIGVIALAIGTSYALFTFNVTKGSIFKTLVGKLELSITDTVNEDKIIVEGLVPTKDEDALLEDGYTFTVTNTGTIDAAYTVYLDDIVPQGETKSRIADNFMKANLTNSKSGKNYTFSLENNRILDTGILTSGESITYTLRLWLDYNAGNEAQDKYFGARIRIDSVQSKGLALLKDVILEQNKVVTSTPTLTTTSEAANEKGLYKMSVTNGFGGQDGDTYYFRGNVTNNYVNFAGYTWRIVRINEDGTVRLIMQDGINNNVSRGFQSGRNGYNYMYYSHKDSDNSITAKTLLDDWYQENIVTKGFGDVVATGNYFCEAAKTLYSDTMTTGDASMVLYGSYTPDLICELDGNSHGLVNANIGLLTYDEAVLSGGYYGISNNLYYIDSDTIFWTMSPSGVGDNGYAYIWYVASNGTISTRNAGHSEQIFRPVINLKATTKVTGNGTSSQPYVVVMNEENNYQVSSAVAAAVSQFNPSDLKDVIMCDQSGDKYTNCKIYNTIDAALADRDTGTIIVTRDITKESKGFRIAAGKDIIVELNGKRIKTINPADLNEADTTLHREYAIFDVYGTLAINGDGELNAYNGSESVIARADSNVIINGGNYNGRRSLFYEGNVVINNGTFTAKNFDVLYNEKATGNLVINGGNFVNELSGKYCVRNALGKLVINNGKFESNGATIASENAAENVISVNINGGTFISNTASVIYNKSVGKIIVIQTTTPIYMTSLAQTWNPVINNYSTGAIDIIANKANKCTSVVSDTTSGLCAYAEGNKATTGNTGNASVRNGSSGTITIDGGTYYGWSQGINNNATGTINIKNMNLGSEYVALANNSSGGTGIINVEKTTIISNSGNAIKNNNAGIVNINSGTYVSNTKETLYNSSTGVINIIQTENPIYMTSLAQVWAPVIVNKSTGTINIIANQANKCTANASDTTSGLCVYAEGDVNATDNTRNGALQNASTGTVNVNGGTYYGGAQGFNNNGSTDPYGILNIRNVKIISDRGIINTYGGTVNVCNSVFENIRYNIYNNDIGTINYNNVTFSNGTTTPLVSEIYNPNGGTVTEIATCPISD